MINTPPHSVVDSSAGEKATDPTAMSVKGRRTLVAKYKEKVVAHGFTVLPNLLFEMQARLGITPTEFNILLHIVQHWWDADKEPFPKIETLARRIGKGERQVLRYLGNLEKAGLIHRTHRFRGKGKQISSAYSLEGLVQKLAALEPDFAKAKAFRDRKMKSVEAKRQLQAATVP